MVQMWQDLVTGFTEDSGVCSIALDIERNKIYWSESRSASTLRRSNLDGRNIEDYAIHVPGGCANLTIAPSLTTTRRPEPVSTPKVAKADASEPLPLPEPAQPVEPSEPPTPEKITERQAKVATLKEVVSIPDANLAAAVRKALGLGTNATITKQAIKKLTRLDARESQIKNLTGLEHATQLMDLALYKNQIRDIKPLAGLTRLKRLDLDENQIRDFQPIKGLTQLEGLYIGGNQINNSEVELLTKFKQLKWLSLYTNKISNITPLANLKKLEGLWLTNNQIRDVSPLAGLVNLKTLHIENNSIRDISPLAELTKLEDLKLGENPITDKSPLRTLKNRNPKLKVDIEIPPLSPIVHVGAAQRPPILLGR